VLTVHHCCLICGRFDIVQIVQTCTTFVQIEKSKEELADQDSGSGSRNCDVIVVT